jgi:hypothetical protein
MSKEETQKLHDMVAEEYSQNDADEGDEAAHSEVTKVY